MHHTQCLSCLRGALAREYAYICVWIFQCICAHLIALMVALRLDLHICKENALILGISNVKFYCICLWFCWKFSENGVNLSSTGFTWICCVFSVFLAQIWEQSQMWAKRDGFQMGFTFNIGIRNQSNEEKKSQCPFALHSRVTHRQGHYKRRNADRKGGKLFHRGI